MITCCCAWAETVGFKPSMRVVRPALIDAHAAAETVRCRARAYSLYFGFYGRWPEILAG
jgi:hypothetical protein